MALVLKQTIMVKLFIKINLKINRKHPYYFVTLGVYLYMEATGSDPTAKCRLISPIIPLYGAVKCLQFAYLMYGIHLGQLRLLSDTEEVAKIVEGGDDVTCDLV